MGVEPTSPAWKAGAFAARPKTHKAEGEGVEPPRLIARPASNGLPSPIGLTFRITSCGGWNRTSVRAVNSRLPVPTRVPPQNKVRMAGFEPAISCSRNTRNTRLSYILPASPKPAAPPANILRHSPTDRLTWDPEERPAGVEPALSPWQGDRLPLHHGRVVVCRIVKDQQSTGRDSNSRRRITGAVSSPLDDQCVFFQWDQRDLNPHLAD